jgi:GDP-4-dehydro-6-deoxy-D-mannose reductase
VADARPRSVIHLASERRREPPGWGSLAADFTMLAHLGAALRDGAADAVLLVPGSAAEYGDRGSQPLAESLAPAPLTAYGHAKAVLGAAVTAEPFRGGLRTIWTRSFNHLGPGQGPDAPVAAWAVRLAEAEAAGGGPVRTGRLDVVRDFLDVRDVADAYLDLVSSGFGGVVNVCSGTAIRLADLARLLTDASDTSICFEEDPALLRAVDPAVVVGDASLLERTTGFRPRVPLEQSVREMLAEARDRVARGLVTGCA